MKHYQEVWEQAQARTKPQHYIFDPANPYLNDPEAFTYFLLFSVHYLLISRKGVQLFDEGHLPEAIKALEAAVQQDTTNVDVELILLPSSSHYRRRGPNWGKLKQRMIKMISLSTRYPKQLPEIQGIWRSWHNYCFHSFLIFFLGSPFSSSIAYK